MRFLTLILLCLFSGTAAQAQDPVLVELFYLQDCADLAVVEANLDKIAVQYGPLIRMEKCDMAQQDCQDRLDDYRDQRLILTTQTPVIIIGGIAATDGLHENVLHAGLRMAVNMPSTP
ncbi:MAG: hypothetical protein L6Q57_02960 [Alphaproteobacteria bacterium]|nr:hypothetical protein [Alphaproteobacteria bacterium]